MLLVRCINHHISISLSSSLSHVKRVHPDFYLHNKEFPFRKIDSVHNTLNFHLIYAVVICISAVRFLHQLRKGDFQRRLKTSEFGEASDSSIHETVKIGHRSARNDLSGFHEDNALRRYISSSPGYWRPFHIHSTRREKERTAGKIRQLRSNESWNRHDETIRMYSTSELANARTIMTSNVHHN